MNTSERVSLPVPGKPDVCLAGILQLVTASDESNSGARALETSLKPIAIVSFPRLCIFDVLSRSRFFMGLADVQSHKDYLYQKKLAAALPIDSFRFEEEISKALGVSR